MQEGSIVEHRGDLLRLVTGDSAGHCGNVEPVLLMLPGEGCEAFYGRPHVLYALHRGDRIGTSLKALADAPDGTEVVDRGLCRASYVPAVEIASEREDAVLAKVIELRRRYARRQCAGVSAGAPVFLFVCIVVLHISVFAIMAIIATDKYIYIL